MKKLLLTLCMTLLCTIGVWAQSVTLSKPEAGTVVINFATSGLWSNYIGQSQPPYIGTANLTDLKNATTVKVTGSISNGDIKEISFLIGNQYNAKEDPNHIAQVLDMSAAQMTEKMDFAESWGGYTYCIRNIKKLYLPKPYQGETTVPALAKWVGEQQNGSLEYLSITEGWTGIADKAFMDCYYLNDAYFPASLKTIGESAFENCLNFETVDLKRCVLVTVIQKNAFKTGNTTSTTTVGLGSKVLNFPPNLTTLEEGAFQYNKAPVLWMPKTIDRIEAYALADFNGNTLLTDIFFTGMTPPSYVHKDAFTKNAQTAGDGDANYNNLSTTGQADRDVYIRQRAGVFNGYCIVMHYPAGSNANMGYWDKENAYESRGRNMRPNVDKDGKASGKTEGAPNLYYYEPDGWLKYKAEKGTLPTYGCYAGYPDVTLGEKKVWPSESQIQGAYKMAQDGYLWNGDKMTAAQLNRQGLYQFVLASADTPSDEIKGYENNLWYTICLPYDMSVAQIKATFGNDTQVCRITKVTREPSGENMGIKLYFQRSVITPGGYGTSDIAKDTQYTSNDTGIKAYYPYMIKPSAETATSTRDQAGNLIRTFSDFQDSYKPGAIRRDIVTAIGQSDEHGPYTYAFVGTHEKTHLLQYSYYLGKNTSGKHQLFFRSATTASGLGLWNPFTALVRPTDAAAGLYDTNFFTKNGAAEKNVKMASLFGDDFDEDEATGIKDIQTNKNFNGKIYSISGQYAGTSIEDLPKGIYMVNGKKFIVK